MIRSEQLVEFGRRAIWDQELSALPVWKARLLRAVRIVYKVVQDLIDGDLSLRAMSLVYTTLLSLVPLLAVSFSVLKGFGVHNQIEPLLLQFLAPLGEKGAEISQNIIGFVENMRVGVLGSLGIGMLIYTVISLLQKIEHAFNFTWHTAITRSFGQRFSDYLSVIMVGPLLMFAAVGLTATVMSNTLVQAVVAIEPFGTIVEFVPRLLPLTFVVGAFTFVYTFVPNVKVKLGSAFVGALVAGMLWQLVGILFAWFVAASARYTAIYSGFAIVIFFMIWLYISWLILLLGASIAFYHQNPQFLISENDDFTLSGRIKERLALLIAFFVGQGYLQGRPALTLERISSRIGLPMDAVGGVVEALEERRLLTRTADDPPGYLPARALESIRMVEVIDAVRSAEERGSVDLARLPAEQAVDQVLGSMERALRDTLADRTLRDFVAEDRQASSGS